MTTKNSISRTFFFSILSVAWTAIIVISLFWIGAEYLGFQRSAEDMSRRELEVRRDIIFDVVDDALQYIEHERSILEDTLHDRLDTRLNDGLALASLLYSTLKDGSDHQQISDEIARVLGNVRFNQGQTLYTIFDADDAVLAPPEAEPTESIAAMDIQHDAIAKARIEGWAMAILPCPYPGEDGRMSLRMTHYRLFEPLNWVIATGVFLEDGEQQLKMDIIDWLEHVSYADDGYIFAGRYDGTSLTEPGKGKNMFDVQDVNGKFIVRELIKTAREGGGFVEYVLPPFEGVRHTSKISYTRAVDDWEWYIGAGLYIDDIEEAIALQRKELFGELIDLIVITVMLLIMASLLAYILTRAVAGSMNRNVESLLDFFHKASFESVQIDTDALSFTEFEQLAQSANRMIDDKNKAQEKVGASEQRFKTLFDNSFEFVGITDADGRLLMANRTSLDFIQSTESEQLGKFFWETPWWRESPEDDLQALRNSIAKAARGSVQRIEFEVPSGDGQLHQFDIVFSPLARDGDKVTQLIIEGRDITEHKQAENAIRSLQTQLSGIIDALPSVVMGIDTAGRITSINKEAADLGGIPRDDALGRHFREILQGIDDLDAMARSAMQEQKVVIKDKTLWSRPDYDAIARVTISPLPLEGGGGAVILIDDITEQTGMEEVVIQTEKMASLGSLAAGMAHEINNPLAAIIGNVQTAMRRLDPGLEKNRRLAEETGVDLEKMERYVSGRGIATMLEAALESSRRAARIVANMLSFSRKDHSGLIPCNLVDSWRKAVELASKDYDLGHHFDFKNIDIHTEPAEDATMAVCDPNQLQQVFFNLLKNGAHAMLNNPKERPPAFIFRTARTKDSVEISISDTGAGMDPDLRKRIFEPFFTTKSPGIGTGLGLSVSYFIIIRTHKGNLQVVSTPGQGTTFIITLPDSKAEHGGSRE